jgi:hypothetical protein
LVLRNLPATFVWLRSLSLSIIGMDFDKKMGVGNAHPPVV